MAVTSSPSHDPRAQRCYESGVLPLLFAATVIGVPWTVTVFDAPDAQVEDADAFQALLEAALVQEGLEVRLPLHRTPCFDAECAASLAPFPLSSGSVVVGRLRPFGNKLFIQSTVFGTHPRTAQIVIDSADDLDAAAARIGRSLATGSPVAQTAELGTITAVEARPDRRREGQRGLSFALGPVLPLDETLGNADAGLAIDLGYWFETRHFAVEPTIGVRFSIDPEEDRNFVEVPLDVGAYWIPTTGDLAPFLGGGAGIRFLFESRPDAVVVGNVIETRTTSSDSAAAFGVFARGGLLLLRTYTLRVSVSARYGVSFVDLNGSRNPQSLTGLVAVHF
ncbi:MAG: hypothetical protein ACFB9M_11110 [Myxococcota bacterium]